MHKFSRQGGRFACVEQLNKYESAELIEYDQLFVLGKGRLNKLYFGRCQVQGSKLRFWAAQ